MHDEYDKVAKTDRLFNGLAKMGVKMWRKMMGRLSAFKSLILSKVKGVSRIDDVDPVALERQWFSEEHGCPLSDEQRQFCQKTVEDELSSARHSMGLFVTWFTFFAATGLIVQGWRYSTDQEILSASPLERGGQALQEVLGGVLCFLMWRHIARKKAVVGELRALMLPKAVQEIMNKSCSLGFYQNVLYLAGIALVALAVFTLLSE